MRGLSTGGLPPPRPVSNVVTTVPMEGALEAPRGDWKMDFMLEGCRARLLFSTAFSSLSVLSGDMHLRHVRVSRLVSTCPVRHVSTLRLVSLGPERHVSPSLFLQVQSATSARSSSFQACPKGHVGVLRLVSTRPVRHVSSSMFLQVQQATSACSVQFPHVLCATSASSRLLQYDQRATSATVVQWFNVCSTPSFTWSHGAAVVTSRKSHF